MYLIKEEKRTLFQFLALYLGSSFTLFAVIAYLFYENQSQAFYEKTRTMMQMNASVLSSKIIYAHMSGKVFSLEEVVKHYRGKIGFYNQDNNPIESSIEETIDFSKQLYQDREKMILIDKSTFGHLGVESIVIEKDGVGAFIQHLRLEIVIYLLLIYLFLSLIGYFLAKLFIKPIQMKRIQLDNFIKDSTHELNTPITALILSLDSPKLESPKNLERIRLSAKRVSEIHKDLSYLMLNAQRGKNEIRDGFVEEILLNTIMQEELLYLTLLAEKKKIVLSFDEYAEIKFKIDKESFVRLFHNLISNAIKYNRIGGSINVIIKERLLIIKDTGMGISKKHQVGIFERFYRASDQVGGFGLGLNIVDKVCQLYNINITFKSKIDYGTTFYLRFK